MHIYSTAKAEDVEEWVKELKVTNIWSDYNAVGFDAAPEPEDGYTIYTLV